MSASSWTVGNTRMCRSLKTSFARELFDCSSQRVCCFPGTGIRTRSSTQVEIGSAPEQKSTRTRISCKRLCLDYLIDVKHAITRTLEKSHHSQEKTWQSWTATTRRESRAQDHEQTRPTLTAVHMLMRLCCCDMSFLFPIRQTLLI